jgi:hypothetical protein
VRLLRLLLRLGLGLRLRLRLLGEVVLDELLGDLSLGHPAVGAVVEARELDPVLAAALALSHAQHHLGRLVVVAPHRMLRRSYGRRRCSRRVHALSSLLSRPLFRAVRSL